MNNKIGILRAAALFFTALVTSGTAVFAQEGAKSPRVAVFFESGFPYYGVTSQTSPPEIARHLRESGVQAELLGEAALADPQRFNAKTFAALVLPYGNTYPDKE